LKRAHHCLDQLVFSPSIYFFFSISPSPPGDACFLSCFRRSALGFHPGGGLAGRGGDKTYAGLRALIQLILQRVGKSNWHQGGAVLSRHFLRSEGRIAGSSVPALLWMIAQLGQRDSEGALRCWFSTMIPVVEHERAGGGKLAAQAVRLDASRVSCAAIPAVSNISGFARTGFCRSFWVRLVVRARSCRWRDS
jgi:hypothetical protein